MKDLTPLEWNVRRLLFIGLLPIGVICLIAQGILSIFNR